MVLFRCLNLEAHESNDTSSYLRQSLLDINASSFTISSPYQSAQRFSGLNLEPFLHCQTSANFSKLRRVPSTRNCWTTRANAGVSSAIRFKSADATHLVGRVRVGEDTSLGRSGTTGGQRWHCQSDIVQTAGRAPGDSRDIVGPNPGDTARRSVKVKSQDEEIRDAPSESEKEQLLIRELAQTRKLVLLSLVLDSLLPRFPGHPKTRVADVLPVREVALNVNFLSRRTDDVEPGRGRETRCQPWVHCLKWRELARLTWSTVWRYTAHALGRLTRSRSTTMLGTCPRSRTANRCCQRRLWRAKIVD
jgi:hypothetical protein